MVAEVGLAYVLADMLCCLGLGFLLAVVYDVARFALGDAKLVCFVLDLAAYVLAAFFLCSYAASRSYSGVVRWYMALALAIGLLGYFRVLAPATRRVQQLFKWLLGRPLVLVYRLALAPLGRAARRQHEKGLQKMRAKQAKRRKKQLQTKGKVLYNSN